jgi:hypothetical protein
MIATGMILDGVAASQAVDSSGEILDIEGCDISTLPIDGTINYEHISADDGSKKLAPGEETVGRILMAKKIFGLSDCENDRQEMYWKKVKVPFIYIVYRLFDKAGHRGAKALAAAIRDAHANNEPILVRLSIEGSTLERDGNRLKSSVARRVSATWKPCNRTCHVGLLADPDAPEGFDKTPENDIVDQVLRNVSVEKTEPKLEHPAYTKLGGSHEVECNPLVFDLPDLSYTQNHATDTNQLMNKALTAGSYDAAPSSLVGGAALQREDSGRRKSLKDIVTSFKPSGDKFDKAEFKAFAKTFLPEVDDSFLDHFADVAEDYHVKRASLKKSGVLHPNSWRRKTLLEPTGPELADEPTSVTEEQLEFPPKPYKNPDEGRLVLPMPPDKGHLISPIIQNPEVKDSHAPSPASTPKSNSKNVVKPDKPKRLTAADIEPATGDELEAAREAATKKNSAGFFAGFQPIVVRGVELKGKYLARYLGIPEPEPVQLTVRGKPVLPPRPSRDGKYGADEVYYDHETGHLNVPARPGTFNMRTGQWKPGHSGGFFKHYIPGQYDPSFHGDDPVAGQKQAQKEAEDFKRLLDDPERTKYHDAAMANWVLTHRLMRQGKTPEEVVAYKTAFSMLSPNTPVPVHEMMFSYLMDSMKHTGIDLRDPKFAGARGHLLLQDIAAGRKKGAKKPDLKNPELYGIYGDWKSRDTGDPNKLPEHAPEHSRRTLHNITLTKDVPEGRKKGQLISFMLAQNKFVNMAKYHKYHNQLVGLFRNHGHEDLGDQKIVNHLMEHKLAAAKFEAAKARALKAKKKTFEFNGQQLPVTANYDYGVVASGLAPKTARLMVTMAGGGSMHVPDTHMNRFQFGLEKGRGSEDDEIERDDDGDGEDDFHEYDSPETQDETPRDPSASKDNRSIAAIKSILWNERYSHILNAMDRYYERHSPAIDHMVERWGHYLDGETPEEKRRHAVFGAFWKNWSAIVDHEKSRGMWSVGKNDYSDHRPSWEATLPHTLDKFPVMPFLVLPNLKKGEEGYDESLPFRCAMLHHMWQSKYGEIGAAHLALVHLIPQLLAAHAIRHAPEQIRKAEALSIEVKKAVADAQKAAEEPEEPRVSFAGRLVVPGRALTSKGEYALLYEDHDNFVGVPKENVLDWCHHHLVRLPKAKQGTYFRVTRRPAVLLSDLE